MAGFRDFQTGEVLTAANVNDFLAKQSVMKFADAAARDTALGTAVGGSNALREGMVAYLDDTNEVLAYDGTAWGSVGLPLGTATPVDGSVLVYGTATSQYSPTSAAGYVYAGTRYYTSSGAFDKADPLGTGDIGLRAIRVKVQGAGGGGAGAGATTSGQSSAGSGGAAGGYCESFITDIASLSASETVTVGAAGSGGSGSAGNTGGNSSFSGMTANGGSGGAYRTPVTVPVVDSGTPGGAASGGDINIPGGSGMTYVLVGDGSSQVAGGNGGDAVLGKGGIGRRDDGGYNSNGPGGGGGGGSRPANRSATTGGAGEDGIVIIDCFV